MRETRVPAIPSPSDSNLLAVARAMKGVLDVREGLTGDALDANVTFRDLVSSGLAQTRPGGGSGSAQPILPPWVENDGYDPTQDFLAPPAPSNVTVTGLFAMVQIQWDEPVYRNHAYAEIWRSETDVIGSAVLIGTSDSRFYVDSLGTSASKFYWVRFVSKADAKGPYNDTQGISGSTAADPTYLMDVLSDAYGSTSQAPFFQIDQPTVINGVSIPAGTYIKQAFIADATISRAKIQLLAVDDARIASINATKITAGTIDANRIGANSITADKIDSRNLTIKDSAGNIIFSASGTSYLNVSGLGALATQNSVSAGNVSGLGALATQNSVSAGQVSGLGSLATQNSVSAGQVSGLGLFAFVDQITPANASTYISSAAIGTAQIADIIQSTNFSSTQGWRIDKSGTAFFNQVALRGEINGGGYTHFSWPPAGQSGFHLGPFGLLLGNFNNGRYFQVNASGDIFAPQFNIVNGSANFTGTVYANALVGDVNRIIAISGDYGGGTIASDNWTTIGSAVLPGSTHPDGHTPTAILTVYVSRNSAGSGAIRLLVDGVELSNTHSYVGNVATLAIAGSVSKRSGSTTFVLQASGTSGNSIQVSQIRGYLIGVR